MKQSIVEHGSQDHLDSLKSFAELWEFPGFQDWVIGVKKELEALKEVPWSLGNLGTNYGEALAQCGLRMPKTREDLLEAFMCARSVVHYVEGNLGLIESQALAYHELLGEIQKRKGNENG